MSAALAEARSLVADATRRLTDAGARDEALARFVPARRVLLIQRAPTMEPLGRVWRLGVLLLGSEGMLYAVGRGTRAVPPTHPNFQSISAEERRGYRAAAVRARYPEGETVNFDARPLPLDGEDVDDPLVLTDAGLFVRWTHTASVSPVPFASYVEERVRLLLEPPQGA